MLEKRSDKKLMFITASQMKCSVAFIVGTINISTFQQHNTCIKYEFNMKLRLFSVQGFKITSRGE